MNRKLARERLVAAVQDMQRTARAAEKARREKARRQRSPRPRALKRRILESKRKRSTVKKLRSKVAE
jgi:hypothetical protein